MQLTNSFFAARYASLCIKTDSFQNYALKTLDLRPARRMPGVSISYLLANFPESFLKDGGEIFLFFYACGILQSGWFSDYRKWQLYLKETLLN